MNLKKWDEYFFNMCNIVASNSKCFSRKIGSVLVKDNTIVGSGYNGPPRGVPECDKRFYDNPDQYLIDIAERILGPIKYLKPSVYRNKCPRQTLNAKSGEMLNICLAAHSEHNAIVNSARMGIKTKGCKLYMNCGIPCYQCFKTIINAGIDEIIVTAIQLYDEQTQYLIDNSNVKIRLFSHLQKEIGY